MTPQEQIKDITDKLVSDLCHITRYPDGWLPHSVWVEEEDDDGAPVYRHYILKALRPDGTCDLHDPVTGRLEHDDCYLSEINIDWLITVWNRYMELCAGQGIWRERVIHLLERETGASLSDILKFVGDHWHNHAPDEKNILSFRQWMASTRSPAASGQIIPKKELFAFVWPWQLMARNATDQQILTMHEQGPSRSIVDPDDDELYEVRCLTPDEFAAEINDNECAFGQCYVRFIETEE